MPLTRQLMEDQNTVGKRVGIMLLALKEQARIPSPCDFVIFILVYFCFTKQFMGMAALGLVVGVAVGFGHSHPGLLPIQRCRFADLGDPQIQAP